MNGIALSLLTTDQLVEPLPQALVALIRSADGSIACDAMGVALGLPFVAVAARSQASSRWAMTFGQDVALIEAANLFGLQVRPMHTRRTAATLEASSEYDLHFHDSYAPLIRRALAHGQPILAWGGWERPAECEWGVITAYDEASDQFHGVCRLLPDESRLVGSPRQCYVVESIEPVSASNHDLIATGASAVRALARESSAVTTFASGPDAFEVWSAAVQREDFELSELSATLERLRRNRKACLGWLREAGSLTELVATMERTVAALDRTLMSIGASDAKALVNALAVAAQEEKKLIATLNDVASKTIR